MNPKVKTESAQTPDRFEWVGRAWLVGCLLVAAALFARSVPGSPLRLKPATPPHATAAATQLHARSHIIWTRILRLCETQTPPREKETGSRDPALKPMATRRCYVRL